MYDVSEIGTLLHRVMQVVLIAPSNTCGLSAPTCKPRSPYPARLTPRCRRALGVALEAVSAHSVISSHQGRSTVGHHCTSGCVPSRRAMTALVLRMRHAYIQSPPDCRPEIRPSLSGCNQGFSLTLKGSAMTPKFLREEAARFRGMADTVEREASRQRLLAMAIDYEAKAKAADEIPEPRVDAPVIDAPVVDAPGLDAPGLDASVKVKVGKKTVSSAAA